MPNYTYRKSAYITIPLGVALVEINYPMIIIYINTEFPKSTVWRFKATSVNSRDGSLEAILKLRK